LALAAVAVVVVVPMVQMVEIQLLAHLLLQQAAVEAVVLQSFHYTMLEITVVAAVEAVSAL
jgi:hypothetical protein